MASPVTAARAQAEAAEGEEARCPGAGPGLPSPRRPSGGARQTGGTGRARNRRGHRFSATGEHPARSSAPREGPALATARADDEPAQTAATPPKQALGLVGGQNEYIPPATATARAF
jgi:hypothetical protein